MFQLNYTTQNNKIPSCIKRKSSWYRYLIGFSYEKYAGRQHRQCFLLNKSCRKSTQSFPRCYVNRGKVTSWRRLVTPLAAPSIIKKVLHYKSSGDLLAIVGQISDDIILYILSPSVSRQNDLFARNKLSWPIPSPKITLPEDTSRLWHKKQLNQPCP
jgi:hypothetical protein